MKNNVVLFAFTFQSGLGQWVVHQQSGKEAQDVFPVHLVGFQNLLHLTQQLLHTEDHSQLFQQKKNPQTVHAVLTFRRRERILVFQLKFSLVSLTVCFLPCETER